jgi:hypothetical protein
MSALDDTGTDLVIYFGTGLASHGFKAYTGGVIFTENRDPVALDFVLGIRDSSDYEDFIQRALFINADAAAISDSLILSARF